jgi:hypothetical protein
MSDNKGSLWHRLWDHRSDKDKKWIKSFIPVILYTGAFIYGVIYLSILNTVNRYNPGPAVKSWFGGDSNEVIEAKNKLKAEIEESYKGLRKRVGGGR